MTRIRRNGEESPKRRRAIDHPDVALWRLVRAGAPTRWLWLESEIIDLEDDPLRSALEREMADMAAEEQERPKQFCMESRPQSPRRASAICRELMGRLFREWRKHWCPS